MRLSPLLLLVFACQAARARASEDTCSWDGILGVCVPTCPAGDKQKPGLCPVSTDICCVEGAPTPPPTPTPAPGTTHLLVGQNWQQEFGDYTAATGGRVPAGASLYTAQLTLGQPIAFMGDGLPFLDALNASHGGGGAGGSAAQPFLVELTLAWKYAPGGCEAVRGFSVDVGAGVYDEQLAALGRLLGSYGPGLRFLLRVEYEVSYSLFTCAQPAPGACNDTTYQQAFRRVRAVLGGAAAPARNVLFVFHVVYGGADAPCLYPGDDAVDVIGVSFFEGEGDACYRKGAGCVNPNVEATLAWAAEHAPSKPLAFPESAPIDLGASGSDPQWTTQFLQHVVAAVERHDVRYWTYINQDWTQHGWQNPPWGDSRVQDSPAVLAYWNASVLGARRFLCAGGKPCALPAASH